MSFISYPLIISIEFFQIIKKNKRPHSICSLKYFCIYNAWNTKHIKNIGIKKISKIFCELNK